MHDGASMSSPDLTWLARAGRSRRVGWTGPGVAYWAACPIRVTTFSPPRSS